MVFFFIRLVRAVCVAIQIRQMNFVSTVFFFLGDNYDLREQVL